MVKNQRHSVIFLPQPQDLCLQAITPCTTNIILPCCHVALLPCCSSFSESSKSQSLKRSTVTNCDSQCKPEFNWIFALAGSVKLCNCKEIKSAIAVFGKLLFVTLPIDPHRPTGSNSIRLFVAQWQLRVEARFLLLELIGLLPWKLFHATALRML